MWFLLFEKLPLSLVCHVWEKSHEASTLNSVRESSLILGCKACFSTIKYTSVRVEKLNENLSILVVDKLDIVCVKVILFFHNFNS